MKTLVITLLAFICTSLPAQEVTELTVPWKTGQSIELNLKYADSISIQAWDKNEIYLKAEVTINDGLLDSVHFITKKAETNTVYIEAGIEEELIKESNWRNCDGRDGIHYNTIKTKNNDCCKSLCTNIRYTLYVPAGADLELETITGDVTITNMKASIKAKSVTGAVEVLLAGNFKADVTLKSVMGRVASYPDLTTLSSEGLRPLLARELNGKLNGGGKKINLESVMGNVKLNCGG